MKTRSVPIPNDPLVPFANIHCVSHCTRSLAAQLYAQHPGFSLFFFSQVPFLFHDAFLRFRFLLSQTFW